MAITTLGDLGERRILREIIPRFCNAAGDDCATIAGGEGTTVITTDPVPPPAATVIAGDADLFWTGWLLVTINASDIAASGARPVAFVAALDLPGTLEVTKFERLLAGIGDSCEANGLRYVGGNIREANDLRAVGTAIGRSAVEPLTRRGAVADDLVVVIGSGGRFWADVERHKAGLPVEKASSPLFSPVSQAKHMHHAHAAGLVRCAMDTSDGLTPTLAELAFVNELGIEVNLASMRSETDHISIGERPERFWMGWGDWTVVAAVQPAKMRRLASVLQASGSTCSIIGSFVAGHRDIILVDEGRCLPMGRLESERFAKDSWFSLGVEEYHRRLLSFTLP